MKNTTKKLSFLSNCFFLLFLGLQGAKKQKKNIFEAKFNTPMHMYLS